MENRISQTILTLYQIRADPIKNSAKIPEILDQLGSLGIEYPGLPKIIKYSKEAQRISEPLERSISLRKCIGLFLSETDFLETEEISSLREVTEHLYSKVKARIQNFEQQRIKITKDNQKISEDLLQQLIGRRLESELIPNLFERMGYKENSTIFNFPDKDFEIDGRYERNFYKGARNERLRKKEVVIVECKTTIDLGEIKKFQKKAEIIKDKYVKDKENWGYDKLDFKAWIVACYGWTKNLSEEAKRRSLIPITVEDIKRELKKYDVFDPRIPICPTND